MKFGPDWLHNLSQDNSTPVTAASSTVPPAAAPPVSAPKPRAPTNNSAPPKHKDKDLKDPKDVKDFKELKDFKNNNNRCRLADHR